MNAAAESNTEYRIEYRVKFEPETGEALLRIRHTPMSGRLIELRMRVDEKRYRDFSATGKFTLADGEVVWRPLRKSRSELSYRFKIDHKRKGGAFDARMSKDWVIVRGDNLFPSARVRTTKLAASRSDLTFSMPKAWTSVDTPFLREKGTARFLVIDPERRFDRPTGWIIAGQISSRKEVLLGTRISVAAPQTGSVQRNVTLALMNGLMPELKKVFGELPSKILIVSADDPMWRGGLSGPRSLFMHADRPLISENGSSTLVHELVHVVSRMRAKSQDDWIVEGLAEYYSIELLYRAGLLSESRRERAFDWMKDHGKSVKSLNTDRSSARVTARSVQVFRELDAEIREATNNKRSLDHVARKLMLVRVVSREYLRKEVEQLIGRESKVLQSELFN